MQLKFILSIVQLLILNQLTIDKEKHSFITARRLFLSVYSAQLISFFVFSFYSSFLLPVSGPPDVSSWMSIASLYSSH